MPPMTPTEAMSSSMLMRALREAGYKSFVSEPRSEANSIILTPEDNEKEPGKNKRDRLTAQSNVGSPSAGVLESCEAPDIDNGHGEKYWSRLRSKRQRTAGLNAPDPTIEEDPPGYMAMTVQELPVQLRVSDCWLNATQILRLAGKSEEEIDHIQQALRAPKRDENQATATSADRYEHWVPFRTGQHLCDLLALTGSLSALLEYGKGKNAQIDAERTNLATTSKGLNKIISLKSGTTKVTILQQDLWVNVTHICRAASKIDVRPFISQLQSHDVRIIKGGPIEQRGTYTSPANALQLCGRLGVEELGQLLRATLRENGFENKATVASTTVMGRSLVTFEKLTIGDIVVYIRLTDLWINVTPICVAAGQKDIRRYIVRELKSDAIEAVKDGPRERKGTYVEPTIALALCERFRFNDLGQALRKTLEGYGHVDNDAISANALGAIVYEAPSRNEESSYGPSLLPFGSLNHGNGETTTATASDPIEPGLQMSIAKVAPPDRSPTYFSEWEGSFLKPFGQPSPGLEG